MFGVALLFFGYVVPGIVILVISAVVALGFIASRPRDPCPSGVGRGSFYGEPGTRPEGTATAITAEETAASTEVVVETAEEVRSELHGVTARE
ncbi:MAG: hypothetical protein M3309_07820 [Actinomycetota bacterium]|nr:hypothetical protein [Actinomycetota bacterium]